MVRIKIGEKDKVRGFYLLLTHYPITAFTNEEYVVPKECIRELKKRKIKFEMVK